MKVVIFGTCYNAENILSTILSEEGHDVHCCAGTDNMGQALKNADIVVSLLTPSFKVNNVTVSNQVKYVLDSTNKAGVKRFIQLSHSTVPDPNDSFTPLFWIFNKVVQLIFKVFCVETSQIAELIKTSDLDWTLIRVGLVKEKPETISTKVGYVRKDMGFYISGYNLANFLAREIKENRFAKKTICISQYNERMSPAGTRGLREHIEHTEHIIDRDTFNRDN